MTPRYPEMRSTVSSLVAAAALAAAGCSSKAYPTQPQMTDETVKELMKQGKDQSLKERGKRGQGKQ